MFKRGSFQITQMPYYLLHLWLAHSTVYSTIFLHLYFFQSNLLCPHTSKNLLRLCLISISIHLVCRSIDVGSLFVDSTDFLVMPLSFFLLFANKMPSFAYWCCPWWPWWVSHAESTTMNRPIPLLQYTVNDTSI